MPSNGRGKKRDSKTREQNSSTAPTAVVEYEERKLMQANYAKRALVPESLLLSHYAQLPDASGEQHQPQSGHLKWMTSFRVALTNIYDLPLDSSVSSTTPEGRRFLDEGVWEVPTTGAYLISALLTRRSDPGDEGAELEQFDPQHVPRVVLRFFTGQGQGEGEGEGESEGEGEGEGEFVDWQFPAQPEVARERDAGSAGELHRAWMARAIADKRNSNTRFNAIDVQCKRRVQQFRGRVEAEQRRRAQFGKQHFHFVRTGQMLDRIFEENKKKLVQMEAEEAERQQKFAAERQASASVANFFGRLFRLRRGVTVRIGLIDECGQACRYIVSVAVALVGDLSAYTRNAQDRPMPAVSCQLPKPFGCFKTAKRFASGEQLIHHMHTKGYHLSHGSTNAPLEEATTAPAEHQCAQCGKTFGSELALAAHTKTKLHVRCKECGDRFRNDTELRQHDKDTHVRDRRVKEQDIYEGWRYLKQYSKAPAYIWRRPKFCCEVENCGRSFMTTEQLAQHHHHVKHFKCQEASCPKLFLKKAHMYRHFKAKHDPEVYRQGLVERLQGKLSRVTYQLEREKFGGLRWTAKKEVLEVKLARALGIPVEEYRSKQTKAASVTEGALMEKSPTSHSVINIVPPRDQWEFMQRIRTLHISDARCGPHISFVEPFVMPQHYEQAVHLLTPILRQFEPFEVTLSEVEELRHEKSSTLYVAPDYQSSKQIVDIVSAILRVFPQCSDLLSRGQYNYRGDFVASKQLNFLPHFTLRKFRHEQRNLMQTVKYHYEEVLAANPIKFVLKEIYILHRIKGDPFQVCHVIPLGPPETHTRPNFGPGSPGSFGSPEEDSSLGRSVLIGGIPQKLQESVVRAVFNLLGFPPKDIEVLKNPDGARRSCAVVELATVADAKSVMETFNDGVESYRAALTELGMQPSSLYLRHMPEMVFPGPPGDCCSSRHIRRQDVDPPEDCENDEGVVE